MSDRIFSYTVILDDCYKDEDADHIQKAIEMIKGVRTVTPLVADPTISFAIEKARNDMGSQIMDIIYGQRSKR